MEDLYLQTKNGYDSIDIDDSSLLPENIALEVTELTTHSISFLKPLAMRMNSETLQFFLSYPTTVVDLHSGNDTDNTLPNNNTESVVTVAT